MLKMEVLNPEIRINPEVSQPCNPCKIFLLTLGGLLSSQTVSQRPHHWENKSDHPAVSVITILYKSIFI